MTDAKLRQLSYTSFKVLRCTGVFDQKQSYLLCEICRT